MVTRRDLCGELGDGIVEDAHVVGHGVGPGVARSSNAESTSPVASAKQNIG